MKSDEIYKDVLQVVASVTGISETGIIHSNKEECANARYLLVRYLAKIFSDTEIASLTNRTKQAVGSMRRNAKKQGVWIVENNWKEIVNKLENKYFICNTLHNIQWRAEACPNILQAFFMLVCKALQYILIAAVTPVWRS